MVIFFSRRVRSRTQYCIFLALLEFKLRKKEKKGRKKGRKKKGEESCKNRNRRSDDRWMSDRFEKKRKEGRKIIHRCAYNDGIVIIVVVIYESFDFDYSSLFFLRSFFEFTTKIRAFLLRSRAPWLEREIRFVRRRHALSVSMRWEKETRWHSSKCLVLRFNSHPNESW